MSSDFLQQEPALMKQVRKKKRQSKLSLKAALKLAEKELEGVEEEKLTEVSEEEMEEFLQECKADIEAEGLKGKKLIEMEKNVRQSALLLRKGLHDQEDVLKACRRDLQMCKAYHLLLVEEIQKHYTPGRA